MIGAFLATFGSEIAEARSWEVDFHQKEFVTAALQPLEQTGTGILCPTHFRLSQLITDIDLTEIGTLSVQTKAPEHLLSTQDGERRANSGFALNLRLEVIGCQFRHHFIPQQGQMTVAGEIGIGRIRETKVSFLQGNDDASLGIGYIAHLAGPEETVSSVPFWGCCSRFATWIKEHRVLGSIHLYLRDARVAIETVDRKDNVLLLSFRMPQIFILSETDSN